MLEAQQSERIQSALYRIAEAANAADDLPAFYETIHGIVGELIDAHNFFVVVYDDAPGLRRAAHTLKSNARTFGAMTLGEVCQAIEESAARGELDGLVERARSECPAVVAALENARVSG